MWQCTEQNFQHSSSGELARSKLNQVFIFYSGSKTAGAGDKDKKSNNTDGMLFWLLARIKLESNKSSDILVFVCEFPHQSLIDVLTL